MIANVKKKQQSLHISFALSIAVCCVLLNERGFKNLIHRHGRVLFFRFKMLFQFSAAIAKFVGRLGDGDGKSHESDSTICAYFIFCKEVRYFNAIYKRFVKGTT